MEWCNWTCFCDFLYSISNFQWIDTPQTVSISNSHYFLLISNGNTPEPRRNRLHLELVVPHLWDTSQDHGSRDMTRPTKWVCALRRHRSAWASAQSDQSLRCPHEESLGPQLPIERTAKTLIRLGRCPGWSESLLGPQSFCWLCHVMAGEYPYALTMY